MTRKNHAHERCAGVSITSSGGRNEMRCSSRPCQPRKFQRPNAASNRPMPPSSAISEITLQNIVSAVAIIGDERFRRPVVRVGIIFVRAQRGTRPGRPTKKGRELPDLFRVGDGIGTQAVFRRGRSEKIRVVSGQFLEGVGLRRAAGQNARRRVVTVGFEIGDGLLPRRGRIGTAIVSRSSFRRRDADNPP